MNMPDFGKSMGLWSGDGWPNNTELHDFSIWVPWFVVCDPTWQFYALIDCMLPLRPSPCPRYDCRPARCIRNPNLVQILQAPAIKRLEKTKRKVGLYDT